jgi:cyclopropane-fatty-acyl-phospholipid synthase
MLKKDSKIIGDLLALADIKINGNRPWDMQVNNPKFYSKVLAEGSIGVGESYMDGWWDCEAIDQLACKALNSDLYGKLRGFKKIEIAGKILKAKLMNLQNKKRSKKVGEQHYDVGNFLYEKMLGKYMAYTCGYWKNAKTLDKSQEAKLDLICKKLMLKPGMTLLDIGCGWGTFAKYAAEKYKIKVVGVTISKEQAKLAKKLCKGLPVEIRFQDYRDVKEKFDRVISIGMFEHVGPKNYGEYMKVVHGCLKDDGLSLLHTIGGNRSRNSTDPWIDKHIFSNAVLPSAKQIATASEGLFVIEDWHNFGVDYDKTLMEWDKNFDKNWDEIRKTGKYDERFYRMWKYYLLICAGNFRSRKIAQLWQIVFSKGGVAGGYNSIR